MSATVYESRTSGGPVQLTHARGEDVAGEQDQGVVLLLLLDSRQEPGSSSSRLRLPGLHSEAVVVVEERDLLRRTSRDHSHGVHCGLGDCEGQREVINVILTWNKDIPASWSLLRRAEPSQTSSGTDRGEPDPSKYIVLFLLWTMLIRPMLQSDAD